MGGRGGGPEDPYPTIGYYHVRIYFFDGQKETLYNIGDTVGVVDTTAYFEVDKWGRTQYYASTRGTTTTGSGETLKLGIAEPTVYGIGSPISLADQAKGHSYRTEKVYVQKLQVWLNKFYPAWALKD